MAEAPKAVEPPVRAAVGRHSSIVYSDDRRWAEHLCAFVRDGLDRHEAMRYFAYATEPAQVLRTLSDAGIDAQEAARSGQLTVTNVAAPHRGDAVFDPDGLIGQWHEGVDAAFADGYRGLRVIGEMSWAERDTDDADRMLEYELRVHHEVFERLPLTGWCFYDRRLMSEERLNVLAGAHLTHRGDSVAEPTLQVAPLDGAPGFLLNGSAGWDTRRTVAAAAAALVRTPHPRPELDFSALQHLDADSLVTLAQAAARRPGGAPLRIRQAPPTLRRLLDLFPELGSTMEVVVR
ncbi:MEDS domain-containing protein [Streptomyces sp. NPDC088745]|uniref:MEDS domain-containing protein n=1 Tax=Streptomyces sp. NPDC088745 TaxID=3365884 RepID=UPI0038208583